MSTSAIINNSSKAIQSLLEIIEVKDEVIKDLVLIIEKSGLATDDAVKLHIRNIKENIEESSRQRKDTQLVWDKIVGQYKSLDETRGKKFK